MKKYTHVLLSLSLLFLLNFSTCRKEDPVSINNPSKNIPVTANATNAFSFVVDAQYFNYSNTQQLQFNADTLSIGITVSGFASGNGAIIIKDGKDAAIYQRDLDSGLVLGEVISLITMPKSLSLNLNNFSGKITIAVAGK